MQDVLDVGLVVFFPKWDIADTLNGVDCVIPSFHIVGSFGFSWLPILMRCHVVGCTWVHKPYIFWVGGVGWVGDRHWVRFVPHHKHSATIVVVGVGGVLGELLACEGRLTLLFVTLCLVVAKLTTMLTLIDPMELHNSMFFKVYLPPLRKEVES